MNFALFSEHAKAVDWNLDERALRLLAFTRRLIRLRREHAELRRCKFFQGRPLCAAGMKDLVWLRPDGGEMTAAEWQQSTLCAFAFRLCSQAMDEVDERGEAVTDDTLLILLNAHAGPVSFLLPDARPGRGWEVLVDTAQAVDEPRPRLDVGVSMEQTGRSLVLLRACP